MSTQTYFEMYNFLVLERRMDTDEARCILSDIEDMAQDSDEAWNLLEEFI